MNPKTIRLVIMLPVLLWTAYTDWTKHRIDNRACFLFLLSGWLLPLWSGWDLGWREVGIAAAATFSFNFILYFLGQGAGDVKLFTAIAGLVGFEIMGITLWSYLFTGVLLIATRITEWKCKADHSDTVPLAPGIALATAIWIIF